MFPGIVAVTPAGGGDEIALRSALDAGLRADIVDDDGMTLLGWAVVGGRLNTERLLIARGRRRPSRG